MRGVKSGMEVRQNNRARNLEYRKGSYDCQDGTEMKRYNKSFLSPIGNRGIAEGLGSRLRGSGCLFSSFVKR